MHDDKTVILDLAIPKFWKKPRHGVHERVWLATLWHVDPNDDSCDWFGSRKNKETGWPDVVMDAYSDLSEDAKAAVNFIWYTWRGKLGRPWWKHPRFHVHHWELQIHFIATLKRWLFSRCCKCGGRFTWRQAGGRVVGTWGGTGPKWFKAEHGIRHMSVEACKKAVGL